jgi:protein-tyrosine phosphatase
MPLRRVALPHHAVGHLWLASMPGRFEAWGEFVAAARRAKLSLTVCLAPTDEVAALSPAYWRAISEGKLPFRWLSLPMQNFGLPTDMPAFRDGIGHCAASLIAGDSVLLHCAAGIGRTGTAAVCVLKQLDVPTDDAMQRVRDAGSNPETALQSGLANQF